MLKRTFDLLIAIPGVVLLSPFLITIALLVLLTSGRPVLFRQQRAGFRGKPFTLFKFRTMTSARDADGKLLPDSSRLTKLGRFLRRTSLDELPALLNVIRGDMSLVGPRPLLVKYLPRYSPEQMRRHDAKPGITGWTQINGRNGLSWEERFDLDVWYVDNNSLALDAKILLLTVWKIVRGEGIEFPGEQPLEFMGSGQDPKPQRHGYDETG